MSSSAMPFLRYLGLDDDADERAIRRAYALRLKAVDQETDPEGFQSLREAYATAMNWLQWRLHAAQNEQANEQANERTVEPVPVEGAALPSASGTSGHEGASARAPAQPDARALAEEVRAELATAFRNRLFTTPDMVRTRLDQALDDPRLIDVDARFFFEWGVAAMLAGGWQPGYELLFDVAVETFHWRHDRARLFSLGQEGRFIDGAIIEFEAFNGAHAPIYYGASGRELITWLREDERPADQVLAQCMQAVEHMAATYPNWLHIVTNTQNIPRWRDWETRRASRRFDNPAPSPRPAAAQNGMDITRSQMMWVGLFVLALFVALGLSAPAGQQPVRAARQAASNAVAQPPVPPRERSQEIPTRAGIDASQLPSAGSAVPSQRASYRTPPVVAYPPLARRMGQQGRVLVGVRVRSDGGIAEVRVVQSSGHAALDEAAVRSVKEAEYVAAKDAQGRNVEDWTYAPFDFRLSNGVPPAVDERALYAELVRATVRSNILFTEQVSGNPVAEVKVELNVDGTVRSKVLSKSSGVPAWDNAVLNALDRTQRMPPDATGQVPPVMIISFRPKA